MEPVGFTITPGPTLARPPAFSSALGKSLCPSNVISSAVTGQLGGCHASKSEHECGGLSMVPATEES